MTSKEALKKICDNVNMYYIDYEDEKELKSLVEIIKKDLEVLSVLKKHFKVEFDDETENGLDDVEFCGLDLDDIWASGCYDDDFKLIKEWLEEK